ncbi:G-protein coupled receptor Mth-like isoform X1 [Drosophila pseudoobscura]|uniref:G-protein coupled receptor Mth-like isoform X1 n=1 Tax=Drosophila pseudoobscura pseudoobscura TaxID=46245 RepID=A0A6I8WB09_DROPS|nr:G-protein coupled receptor Mth isoform X1 [Drosophila pseudoobscura]XP_015043605.2 G-protein coupled receptor Mth isoform X1 [Drosophila pseudoobscura]XP_033240593.1 G-protein coupled receptor Mth isoform X1 [Drosophila pseudoobscura]XP_033240595.1 G-protein coupled receptor Mth isoform X1 [Drosophila pseudoobscura]XP_033240596.1 G-protein coupled receptor Mth isoform X1 [Drosophila pseudoobscura]XP_033240597.1 G-protein coupled receptor Mth isoform X1 [Drosophila pseudoobscura]
MLLILSAVCVTLLNTATLVATENETIPDCDYFDTVNVTGSQRLVNGSYLYQGVVIPAELTAEFDYRVLPDDSTEPVERHLRGCVCQLRPCLRLCCHHSQLMANGQCSGSVEVDLTRLNPYLSVTLDDGTVARRHFQEEFIIQSDLPIPCNDMYPLNDQEEQDQYIVFENGSFFRPYDSATMSKREYCLQAYDFREGETESFRIVAHNCSIKSNSKTGKTVVIILTLVCLACTITVYLKLKKLRNLHGKCFVCCLSCLFMGYLFLLMDLWELTNAICKPSGYIGYYFVMANFLWLSVISWNLHSTFSCSVSRVNRYRPKYVFLVYNVYAWGMASVLTAVIYMVDHLVEDIPENEPWMPGVGFYNCWIKTQDWSAMLYFFGPMLIVIIFNVTMFILTAIRIVAVKRELQSIVDRQERKQKLNSDKQTYSFFLRLFVIMGLNWSLEILSYLVQDDDIWKNVFLVADYLNWSTGIIIFFLFVMKRSVLRLFRERNLSRSTRSVVSMKFQASRHLNGRSTAKQPRDNSSSQASTQI